jgi:hypothetical protein
VQLRDVDPNNLLTEEQNEFLDASLERFHALSLLCDDAAPLLLQVSCASSEEVAAEHSAINA